MVAQGRTSKDITIKFTGENLLGPVIAGLQKQLNDLNRQWKQPSGKTDFMGVGAALDAQQKFINKQKEFYGWIKQQARSDGLTTEQVAARAIARRNAWMAPFLDPEIASRGMRFGSSNTFVDRSRPGWTFGGAAKKGVAGFGLMGGMAGDAIGGSAGDAIGAMGNIAGQAALGGMAAGPWGAAIFGSIAALKEFKEALEKSADVAREEMIMRANRQHGGTMAGRTALQSIQELRQSVTRDPEMLPAQKLALINERLETQRLSVNTTENISDDERRSRRATYDAMLRERDILSNYLAGRGLASFGRRKAIGFADMFFNQPFAMARGAAQSGLSSAQQSIGQFMADAQLNMQVRNQSRSGAGQLSDQWAELLGMRSRLNPEIFEMRRRQLRMDAIEKLPGADRTPGLAPTEGRFITMGRRNEVKDELSHLRRELKAEHAKDRAALAAAIREIGGGNDAL